MKSNSQLSSSTYLYIMDGKSSVAYTVYAHPDYNYIIQYVAVGIDYFSSGYYGSSGTVEEYDTATAIDMSSGDRSGIDLNLLPSSEISYSSKTLSGRISLPSGEVAPAGGISVNVGVDRIYEDGSYNSYGYKYLTIAQGQSYVDYSFTLYPYEKYRVYYSISNSDYVSNGYYSSNGTVADSAASELLDMSSTDKSNINMTLLRTRVLSGSISIPEGVAIPGDGVPVTIYLERQITSTSWGSINSIPVTIYSGENAAAFNFSGVIPNSNYRLRYVISCL